MGWKIAPFMMSTCCDGCDGIETFFGMHHIMNLLKTRRNGIPDDGKLPGLIWSFLVKMMIAQWGEPDLRWGYGGTPRITLFVWIWEVWCFLGDDHFTEVLLSCHFTFKVGSW